MREAKKEENKSFYLTYCNFSRKSLYEWQHQVRKTGGGGVVTELRRREKHLGESGHVSQKMLEIWSP